MRSLIFLLTVNAYRVPNRAKYDAYEPEVSSHDGKCRTLIMRGGGGKGAFEVGALQAITDLMEPIEYAYDVVAGVSIGGLNAGIMASFPRGSERAAAEYLTEYWVENPVIDLWSGIFLNFIRGFWRETLFNTSSFLELYNFAFDDITRFYRAFAV